MKIHCKMPFASTVPYGDNQALC